MRDLIRIGYYNSSIPIDRPRISRYRLQSMQEHACTLRVLSHSSPLTASLFLCVERSCRCSGIHLAKYKQEAYIAFCISRRPNSNNQLIMFASAKSKANSGYATSYYSFILRLTKNCNHPF